MSNQHTLKIHPQPLADLLSGAKTCEVRFNDRGFEVGDTVRLQEIDPTTEQFTGRPDLVRVITHIQQGYGLPDHLCVLSYAQPAAGEPEQQTAANAEDLPTKKYPLGAFDFDSPSSAPVAAGEPVYQHKNFSGEWAEIDKVYYEYQKRHDWPVRILWTAPPAAAHGDEAVLTFEYVGPRNERKTVEVTREEVADHLDYMLFEKLTAAVCGCDPAESDDCRCDEYAEQFTMRVQAGEGGE